MKVDWEMVGTWTGVLVVTALLWTCVIFTAYHLINNHTKIRETPVDVYINEVKEDDRDKDVIKIYNVKYEIEYKDGDVKTRWRTVDEKTYEEVQNAVLSTNQSVYR